jgi:hypothetical protein
MSMRSLDDIKSDFLAKLERGEMFTGLQDAVKELERPEGHAMTQHHACVLATRWAIDEDYFSEDDEQEVEQAAEKAISTGQPA